jgi:ABC-type Mn2+/Zn2+ transport system ATPase subunit
VGLIGRFTRRDHDAVDQAISLFNLDALSGRQIKELSGGQQQRVFLARSWAQEADLYLLDEPFSGLDRTSGRILANALHSLRDRGKLLLVSHHAIAEAESLFDTAILLNGELIACGPTMETLNSRNLECAYGTAVYSGDHSDSKR